MGFNVIFELGKTNKEIVINGLVEINNKKENLVNFLKKYLAGSIQNSNDENLEFPVTEQSYAVQNFYQFGMIA